MAMADLTTSYLGLPLAHPVVASAGPLSHDLDGIRRLEDGGAAAIVLFSLFEEQIRRENAALEHLSVATAWTSAETESYFPAVADFEVGPGAYLDLVRRAREAVRVPVIASLNGITSDGWVDYACQLHEAGASAIELNLFHIPADLRTTGREVEQQYEDVVNAVSGAVPIPVAVKLSPYFSATGEMAQRFVRAGASGLVLFNRFYQPDLDLETRDVVPRLELSRSWELRLPVRWIALLRPQLTRAVSLAATSGVHAGTGVVMSLMAGADVAMMTSALLRNGPGHVATVEAELRAWLADHEYESVAELRGSASAGTVRDPSAFERANYMRSIRSWATPPDLLPGLAT
jgi:dihydroorotate dehydrogenase (fumarate)